MNELEFTPIYQNITGNLVITIRGPDGQIKHVEQMEVKPE